MARGRLNAVIAVTASTLIVLALAVHLSHRSDLLEDVLAAPASGDSAVAPLVAARTTLPVSQTTVRHSGDVSLRVSANAEYAGDSSVTVKLLGVDDTPLATCHYPSDSFRDTTQLRCPVHDLSQVRRAQITVDPKAQGLGVVGNDQAVGTLLVPRSHSFAGRLRTILGRIGTKHPSPFSGWLVPIGTIAWLSALIFAGLWMLRPEQDPEPGD